MRRLRTTHELILNAAGEGVYGSDTDGNVTFGNAATLEILGWKPEDGTWSAGGPTISITTPTRMGGNGRTPALGERPVLADSDR